jgi:DNA-binding MarR family transcriptional regulator
MEIFKEPNISQSIDTACNLIDACNTLEERAEILRQYIIRMGKMASVRDPLAEIHPSLSPPVVHAILWLGNDGPLTANKLSKLIKCSAPHVTSVLDRLESLQLAHRVRSEEDRRTVSIELTEQGHALYDRLRDTILLHLRAFLRTLDNEEQTIYLKLTMKALSTLETILHSTEINTTHSQESPLEKTSF